MYIVDKFFCGYIYFSDSLFFNSQQSDKEVLGNKDEQQTTTEETTQSKLVTKKLSTLSLTNYFNISINQINQVPTLVTHRYFYENYGGGTGISEGMQPPEGKRYYFQLDSKYSVSTTFSITVQPKSSNYSFSEGTWISFKILNVTNMFTVYIDTTGNGTRTCMVSENLYSPNKSYRFAIADIIASCGGEVTYSENVTS